MAVIATPSEVSADAPWVHPDTLPTIFGSLSGVASMVAVSDLFPHWARMTATIVAGLSMGFLGKYSAGVKSKTP